jgi:hypothetical protein
MIGTGLVGVLFVSLMSLLSGEVSDFESILQIIFNAIETAIGFLILGILTLIYLLGLIPNPFPWLL